MSQNGNRRAAARRAGNPLKAIDKVWKAAAGPTQPVPSAANPPTPVQAIAGTPSTGGAKRYRKGRGRPD